MFKPQIWVFLEWCDSEIVQKNLGAKWSVKKIYLAAAHYVYPQKNNLIWWTSTGKPSVLLTRAATACQYLISFCFQIVLSLQLSQVAFEIQDRKCQKMPWGHNTLQQLLQCENISFNFQLHFYYYLIHTYSQYELPLGISTSLLWTSEWKSIV